jgi:hypothetical protein
MSDLHSTKFHSLDNFSRLQIACSFKVNLITHMCSDAIGIHRAVAAASKNIAWCQRVRRGRHLVVGGLVLFAESLDREPPERSGGRPWAKLMGGYICVRSLED